MKRINSNFAAIPDKVVFVTPTPGLSFEEDMAERDSAAQIFRFGAKKIITLHADLDDREIRRIISRYQGCNLTFVLAGHDSTSHQRKTFLKHWVAAGGYDIINS